ncbi:hypothetical protein VXC91_44455, partial [Streptomyces chiangmaiensis]|nr:hypothetical protein [Streptomyces chiangmaiensis]
RTRLHELLVRIAMDEVFRRSARYRMAGPELNDVAHQAAADALMRITHKIQEFRRCQVHYIGIPICHN